MSKNLPYEDEINRRLEGDDSILPDMEESWQQMRRLLDEDKKRRLPPYFLNCLFTGILLIAMGIGGYLFYPTKKLNRGQGERKALLQQRTITSSGSSIHMRKVSPVVPPDKDPLLPPAGKVISVKNHPSLPLHELRPSKKPVQRSLIMVGKQFLAKQSKFVNTTALRHSPSREQTSMGPDSKVNDYRKSGLLPGTGDERGKIPTVPIDTASGATTEMPVPSINDTVTRGKPTSPAASVQKNRSASNKYHLGAGIGVQQQIPMKGQKAVPYNYYGRTGSLADYIPSAYLRLYRGEHWFVQAEFRFGGPQQTKQLDYNQARVDSFGASVTRRYVQLKKTYYHQLSATFHYFLRRNISFGGGFMVSRFYRAISEEEIRKKDLVTQQETVLNKSIIKIPASTDSFFMKSQVHALLEAQYQWKRLSLGVRYTKGLQPFIRYQSPSGEAKSEKNEALQLFLRYELWKK